MKHEDMNFNQRKVLEQSLLKSEITIIEVFTEEPFIQLKDGTVIHITEVEK